MKVISIIEPWASLIKEGVKEIETRSWKTNYSGKIYIHASLKKIPRKDTRTNDLVALLKDKKFKYGNIIAEAELVDCIYMDKKFLTEIKKNQQEYICGEYSLGRYAWVLTNVKILDNPIPAKGNLGIWNYND